MIARSLLTQSSCWLQTHPTGIFSGMAVMKQWDFFCCELLPLPAISRLQPQIRNEDMCKPAWVTLAKCHDLGGLNPDHIAIHYFTSALKTRSSKSRCQRVEKNCPPMHMTGGISYVLPLVYECDWGRGYRNLSICLSIFINISVNLLRNTAWIFIWILLNLSINF